MKKYLFSLFIFLFFGLCFFSVDLLKTVSYYSMNDDLLMKKYSIYKYIDGEVKLSEEIFRDSNDERIKSKRYYYSNDKLIKIDTSNEDMLVFIYDDKNLLFRVERKYTTETLHEYWVYKYSNENDSLKSISNYNALGKMKELKILSYEENGRLDKIYTYKFNIDLYISPDNKSVVESDISTYSYNESELLKRKSVLNEEYLYEYNNGEDLIKVINKKDGIPVSYEIYEYGLPEEIYDEKGINPYGFDSIGYDENGFDKNGFDKNGFDKYGFNEYGFDVNGINKVTNTPYDINGYNELGFDKSGFNETGYDEFGFNKHGYDKNGYDEDGFDKYGYDKDGYDKKGFNSEGFNRDGVNRYTGTLYDLYGYDRFGFNQSGFDKNGRNKYTGDIYDSFGFDKDGYDKNGFDKNGINRLTSTEYDPFGFNKNGFNRDGINRYTRTEYDMEGFDVNGYDKDGNKR